MPPSTRIPIVIANYGPGSRHDGFTEAHINYAIAQARFSNPEARIIVFGDELCRQSLLGIESEFIPLSDYDHSWAKLKEVYVHLSPNSEWFELFAIAKWFIFRDWMNANDLPSCLSIDPDLMLYASLHELAALNGPAMIMSSMKRGTHCSLASVEALDQLCELILSTYQTPSLRKDFEDRHRAGRLIVQDMTFFERLCQILPAAQVFDSLRSDPMFDHNFNGDFGGPFVTEGGVRKVTFAGTTAHGTRTDGTSVRFGSLHFQGAAKVHMHNHLACLDSDHVGKGLIHSLQAGREALRNSALQEEGLINYAKRSGKLRELSEQLNKRLQRIEQSRWLRMASAFGLSKAQRELDACREIRKAISKLAPRSKE